MSLFCGFTELVVEGALAQQSTWLAKNLSIVATVTVEVIRNPQGMDCKLLIRLLGRLTIMHQARSPVQRCSLHTRSFSFFYNSINLLMTWEAPLILIPLAFTGKVSRSLITSSWMTV